MIPHGKPYIKIGLDRNQYLFYRDSLKLMEFDLLSEIDKAKRNLDGFRSFIKYKLGVK